MRDFFFAIHQKFCSKMNECKKCDNACPKILSYISTCAKTYLRTTFIINYSYEWRITHTHHSHQQTFKRSRDDFSLLANLCTKKTIWQSWFVAFCTNVYRITIRGYRLPCILNKLSPSDFNFEQAVDNWRIVVSAITKQLIPHIVVWISFWLKSNKYS